MTGGICSCCILVIAGSRRTCERRRTAASASKKGNGKDRLETGWRCRRRRNEGLAPVRLIASKRVRARNADVFFCGRAFRPAWSRPSASPAEDAGRAPSVSPFEARGRMTSVEKGAQKTAPARQTAPALRSLSNRRKTGPRKQSPPYPPTRSGRGGKAPANLGPRQPTPAWRLKQLATRNGRDSGIAPQAVEIAQNGLGSGR